ncbi:homeodomain-interacting protein kinase 3-like isoform X2 [Xyrichtys novacula]|uniref:Homeodomain-interacting protein kinase 3-like isoform X2 n=1 Tax=Xyrichtys novacula TaxID=13765 RepID=A0AAV1H3E3_XYRNO|nr:homeodomain-interacting protein kinase 3-like isoform X2 [Xyrichtys novacula]
MAFDNNKTYELPKMAFDNKTYELPKMAFDNNKTYELPKKYKYLKDLGEGSYGVVVQCLNTDTNKTVAIKIPKLKMLYDSEMKSMRMLMRRGLNRRNIVTFHESFSTMNGEALVFENLGIDIQSYIDEVVRGQMMLSDVRTITVQIATALNALKEIRVIHRDIKPDNVMLVDETRPFKVKLIDFGFATSTSLTKTGEILQAPSYRAPEIILGLRYSEAIDMWSVGCMVFYMITHMLLFSGSTAYDIEGMNTQEPQQFKQCMKLIKAMLKIDQHNRITPCDVLRHPFVTQKNQTKTRASTSVRPLDFNPSAAPMVDLIAKTKVSMVQPASPENTMQLTPLDLNPSAAPLVNLITQTKVSMVQPASPENTMQLTPLEFNPSAAPSVDLITPTKVSMVQPASPENTMQLEPLDLNPSAAPLVDLITQTKVSMVQPASPENTMQLEPLDLNPSAAPSVDLITQTKVSMVQPASPQNTMQLTPLDLNPSAARLVDLITQTKVIMVQPASPENTMQLEPLDLNPSAAPSVDLITQTKVIMVQPASPENTMQLEPLDLNPSAARLGDLITQTKVIMVQPASPKNTSQLEDTEREVRLQAEPKKTPEVSKAHPPPPDAGKETKKKKKNCCQRFFAWIRKTFRCNQVGVMGVTCSETS